jgi:rare lipoprotein A (peptidoglycan hydrolase)
MSATLAKKIVLALLALGACAGTGAPSAPAATGGASAPPTASQSSVPSTGHSPATGGRTSATATRPSSKAGRKAAAKIAKTALATWFGPGFYGLKTACGQIMTPTIVGVAHRTLPCGTLVQIGYRGHRLTVPVLDRGPYSNGADWDLTAGAAQALGIADTVRISTRVVGSTPNVPSLGVPPGAAAEAATGGALGGGASGAATAGTPAGAAPPAG